MTFNVWNTNPPSWLMQSGESRFERYSERMDLLAELALKEVRRLRLHWCPFLAHYSAPHHPNTRRVTCSFLLLLFPPLFFFFFFFSLRSYLCTDRVLIAGWNPDAVSIWGRQAPAIIAFQEVRAATSTLSWAISHAFLSAVPPCTRRVACYSQCP